MQPDSRGQAVGPAARAVGAPFAWPPRRGAADAASPRRARDGEGPAGPAEPRSWWREAESAWLDVTAAPLPERLAAADFHPDEPWAYCPRCGETLGPHEHDATAGCTACRGSRFPWSRFVRLGEYAEPLDRIIHDIKFTGWRRLGEETGRILGRALAAAIDEALHDQALAEAVPSLRTWKPRPRRRWSVRTPPPGAAPIVLVPAPTSFLRRMQRGIDHPLVIARGVSRVLGAPIVRALARDHRPSQTSVPSSERAANVARSIRLCRTARRDPALLAGRLVIVIDDVVTTGATMRSACRHVRRAMGSPCEGQVWAAAVARTPDPERVRRAKADEHA